MHTKQLKLWNWLHKWSSLVSTGFLLMLCITGLPLTFHDEIDELFTPDRLTPSHWSPDYIKEDQLTLDELLTLAQQNRPNEQPIYMSFDTDRPVINVTTGPTVNSPGPKMHFASFDAINGELVPSDNKSGSVMDFILQLHTDMFMGIGGMLLLASMGLLFLLASISGIVLYYQFMRKLPFGTIRLDKKRRVKWLDYHNFFGVITLAWVLVVGFTGVINALEKPILDTWRENNLNKLIALHQGTDVVTPTSSLHEAIAMVKQASPNMILQFVAFPGSEFSTNRHYAIFLHGNSPLTKELSTPVLIDAVTGKFAGISKMPWYMKILSLSRPLHFGDYGNLTLKIVWALLNILTIWILLTGLYLWYKKYRTSNETR